MPATLRRMTPRKKTSKAQFLRLAFSVAIEKDEDKSFHAFCPAFKGLHVDGSTEKEALDNAIEAVRLYIQTLVRHGDPLPLGPDFAVNREEKIPAIPRGAFLRHIELQWPSLEMSGSK